MCHIRFILLIISVFFITACNVGDESFSAGGVSLGGSGTGRGEQTLPPGGAHPPEGEFIFEEPDVEWELNVIYSDQTEQNCGVIQRSLQFIDPLTQQLINGQQDLPEDNNVILQVNIQNLSQQPVYEFINNCQPIMITNTGSDEIARGLSSSCSGEESLQVYQPYQIKTFQYVIPLETYYNYSWTLNYQSEYASTALAEKSSRMQCPAAQIKMDVDFFEIIPEEQDRVASQADQMQDDDLEFISPPSLQFLPPPGVGGLL